jgi:hypothetical protein
VNAVFDSGDLSHADFTKVDSFRGVKYRKHAVNTTGTLWPSDEQPEEID